MKLSANDLNRILDEVCREHGFRALNQFYDHSAGVSGIAHVINDAWESGAPGLDVSPEAAKVRFGSSREGNPDEAERRAQQLRVATQVATQYNQLLSRRRGQDAGGAS